MSKLTLEEAKVMVAEILSGAPDTRFDPISFGDACVYFNPDDGSPSCVVGHVFARIGITRASLDAFPRGPLPNTTVLNGIEHVWEGKISKEAAGWLRRVQERQDSGFTWGEIYEEEFGNDAADQ